MRRLLLLDADVVIDLHTLGLFEKIEKSFDVCLTRTVFEEARFYRKEGVKIKIKMKDAEIIEDLDFEILKRVQREAEEASLGIDPGESTSIAYLIQTETDISFCTCDRAAIKLISPKGGLGKALWTRLCFIRNQNLAVVSQVVLGHGCIFEWSAHPDRLC